jgi:hypothetical protein
MERGAPRLFPLCGIPPPSIKQLGGNSRGTFVFRVPSWGGTLHRKPFIHGFTPVAFWCTGKRLINRDTRHLDAGAYYYLRIISGNLLDRIPASGNLNLKIVHRGIIGYIGIATCLEVALLIYDVAGSYRLKAYAVIEKYLVWPVDIANLAIRRS